MFLLHQWRDVTYSSYDIRKPLLKSEMANSCGAPKCDEKSAFEITPFPRKGVSGHDYDVISTLLTLLHSHSMLAVYKQLCLIPEIKLEIFRDDF